MKKLTYEQFVETLQPYEIEGGFGVTLEKGYKMYYLPNEHPLLNHKFKHKNKRKAYQEYLELVKDKMASGGSIKGDLKALWNKTVEIAKKGYDKTKEVSKKKIHDGKKSIAIDVINETKSKVGKADKSQLTKAKSIISKKFAKGGLIESFVLQHNDLNRKEMMSIGLSKGDLMKMAYGENTRNVDSALPMGLLEELGISNDERYHYVMDYQTNSFGKLTDLFEKIEERNPKVEVWNTDYEKLDVLPILEAAKKYKNKEVFFQYREQSNKMATGGGVEDFKVGDSVIYAKKFTGINNQGKIVGIEGNGQVFTIKNNMGLVEIVPRISIIKKVNIMATGGGVEKPKRKKFLLYTNPNNTTSRAYIAIGEEVKEVLRDSREYPGSYYILYQATGTDADLQKAKEMFSNYSFDSSIEIMATGGGVDGFDSEYWLQYNERNSGGIPSNFFNKSTDFENTFKKAIEKWNIEAEEEGNEKIKAKEVSLIKNYAKKFFEKEKWISIAIIQAMIFQGVAEDNETTSTSNSEDEILAFEKVKPGMYATSVDDEPFEVVAKGYGYEYDSKLKKYDRNGIVKDIKDNPDNYGMEEGDFESQEWVVVNMENEANPSIFTYDTDGMVVYENRLPAPLSFYDEEEQEEESIDYEISDIIMQDMFSDYQTKEEIADLIADDLGLIQANVIFDNDYFEVKGVRKNGDRLEVSQRGEFTKFGGPYSPKMEQAQVLLNGENITKEVEKALQDHYGTPNKALDPNDIMLFRVDIWGYILDKISSSKATQTNTIATPNKNIAKGAAAIKVELSNGNITVYHSTSNEVLLSLKDVPEGTWNKLWDFLRNDLV